MKETVFRPKAPAKKINSRNEFELCYMRHQYIRKSVYNPTEKDMKPYYDIIDHFSYKSYYTYLGLFMLVGFEREDLVNICKIHLASFLGLFALQRIDEKRDKFIDVFLKNNGEVPNEKDILDKNKADFTCFLKQRLEDVVRICRQKARNIRGKQTDEFLIFYGPKKPPEDVTYLATNYIDHGYKKLDFNYFKTLKRKIKDQKGPIYTFGDNYYVCVKVDTSSLKLTDFIDADCNPFELFHNMTPEDLLCQIESEEQYEDKKKSFLKSDRKYKNKQLRKFISLHKNNPRYNEEVETARKMLKNL